MGISIAGRWFFKAERRASRGRVVPLAAAVMFSFAAATSPASAIEEAQAAKGPPFKIPVLISTRTDQCYDPGDAAAIKRLALWQQHEINRRGGVSGRPIEVYFLDDGRDQQKSIENVRKAIADPDALAIVGLSGATRAKGVFEALGPGIQASGIPFLSDISVNKIFGGAPNVYSMRASQDSDSVPVMAQFTRQLNFARPAFVGLRDMVGSIALGDGLKKALGENGLVADIRLGAQGEQKDKVIPSEIPALVAELKLKDPDLLYLTVGGDNAAVIIKELTAAGITPALFISGRIETLAPELTAAYPNAIYSLAWDQPPEVYSARMYATISGGDAQSWMFEGAKVAAAPGWAKGECKQRIEMGPPNPLNSANLRAISVGSQFADMVALAVRAAETDDKSTDIKRLRTQILKQLSTVFVSGHGAFKGSFDNWSFVPAPRTAARDPFIIILPQGLGRTQLAPVQFVRTKDGSLRQMDTLYVDIDMIKVHRVSENDKTFFAEFYLAMRDNPGASIDRLEFSNAYLDASAGAGRQITIETIHGGGASPAYPESMKIYKVSGRFLYDPELANYPFDTETYAINIQPKRGESPFIVQPPPLALRDHNIVTDGWDQLSQYVSYDADFVPVIDAYTHESSVVPFYKTSFAWDMRREATDYFLRVVVPLGFILFVAYLSIFISRAHFEAIVTIQVTALLSSVALYLSLAKLDSGAATLSDRAFVFAYMILSIMIGISILRVNPRIAGRSGAERILGVLHIAAIPAFVAVAAYYVYRISAAAG